MPQAQTTPPHGCRFAQHAGDHAKRRLVVLVLGKRGGVVARRHLLAQEPARRFRQIEITSGLMAWREGNNSAATSGIVFIPS